MKINTGLTVSGNTGLIASVICCTVHTPKLISCGNFMELWFVLALLVFPYAYILDYAPPCNYHY